MSPSVTWVGVSYGAVSRTDGATALTRSHYQADAAPTPTSIHELAEAGTDASSSSLSQWLLLPADAPAWAGDRHTLWTRAGQAERRYDAQEARFLDVTWPRQLPLSTVAEAVELIYGPFRRDGLAVQIDLHIKTASDGLPNVHLHGLISTRTLGPDGFSRLKYRALADWFHSVGGFAARQHVADVLNLLAGKHASDITFDPRSNAARGRPVSEDRLSNSYIRRPDTEAARDLLARRDLQRHQRRTLVKVEGLRDRVEARIGKLERELRADLDALPWWSSIQPSEKRPLPADDWATLRRSVPMVDVGPPISLGADGIALDVGSRAVIDEGDRIRIEGALDNAAGLVLLALSDRKGWEVESLQSASEAAPSWFSSARTNGSNRTLLTTVGPLTVAGVHAVADAWRRMPQRSKSTRSSSFATSRTTAKLMRRLAVARLPASGRPSETDIVGLMHEISEGEAPGVAMWEVWKSTLDFSLLAVSSCLGHKPKPRPGRMATGSSTPAPTPPECDPPVELKFI